MNLKDITKQEKADIIESLNNEIYSLSVLSGDNKYSWVELKKSAELRDEFNTLNNKIEALKKMIKILRGK